uniref:C-type lectin domain-containing protein n=2 Tax=Poecilia formosa TaxID=48698 RepID=A0A096M8V6_POEFO
MALHEDQHEMSAIYDNINNPVSSNDIPKSLSGEDSNASSATSGVQLYKIGTVAFGLLALLLLGLVIFLACYMEVRSRNFTEERSELKKTLNDLVSKQNSLTEERDNLTRKNSDTEARLTAISLERDELRKSFNITDSQLRSVTEERDRLKVKIVQLGWRIFGGSAYYISSTEKTWQESRTYCQSVGADLMIINSKEEQDFANSFQTYMWIGLTDSETEGRWKWVDGSPLTTSYWRDGEPNGKTVENCGDIKTFTAEKSWNDENCSHSHKWICEMKLS